jgi:molecular chaperone HtpG
MAETQQTTETQPQGPSNEAKTHQFQADVNRVLNLVINSLYTNREVFLRELLSNASDALDKLRFRTITEPELMGSDEALRVRIMPDQENNTLTIWDNGIGMNAEALERELGTVAHSGSKELLEKLQQAQQQQDLSLIGQFGVGFYSAFLVADQVEVTSLAAGERQAYKWSSDGKQTYTIEPAQRAERGTSIVLHLREDHTDMLKPERLRELVGKYSDYLGYPIELEVESDQFETINTGKALWQRPASEVTEEQYQEFYKHLTHDFEPPLAWKHFKVEGTQEFVGLVFVPKNAPYDLYVPEPQHGIRLHVKRVFVMDNCNDLLPRWLRFIRGVVDSEDLPLNVSRESLQDSRVIRTIRKTLTKRVLDMIEEMARDRQDDYATFWRTFGPVVKEGLYFEPEHRDRIAELLRYESSRDEGLVSLAEYKARMPEGQKAIYYALGESRQRIEASPHLEVLKKRGYEVLYMTDAVDQWAVSGIGEYDGVPLVSANDADLKLDESDQDQSEEQRKEKQDELQPLIERFRDRLQDHVSEVRVSDRLTDSPVCLVIPEGGLQPWIERLIRANQQQELPRQKRIMEINPDHTLIRNLKQLQTENPEHERVDEWVDMLFDQALLAEGSPIEDPAQFAQRMSRLLEQASEQEVQSKG